MPKVKHTPVVPETIYNQDLGGVKVTIQLHSGQSGVPVVIFLPYPCAWRGRLVQLVQRFQTDDLGRVVVMLPPSDELVPLREAGNSFRNRAPVLYKLQCEPTGLVAFEVPNVPEWTLGE